MQPEPDKITLSQLEQYLSKAAWILKGPVDASDFKVYIFPLLFFKRISDVYDEEFQMALEESGGDTKEISPPCPNFTGLKSPRAATEGAGNHRERRPGHRTSPARYRTSQSGVLVRHLWRCPVEQQKQTLRSPADRPDRTLLPIQTLPTAPWTPTCSASPTNTSSSTLPT